uniref:Uncharacterized protein n=1 Tax=Electrophorus electricus TaxID=8005 RepID=A0A4W4GLU4_ELEEL
MAEIVHMIDSEVFMAFSTCATTDTLKMMLIPQVIDSMEVIFGGFAKERKKMMDTDVNCHQNDLENIVPFVLVSLALLHFQHVLWGLSWVVSMVITFSMAYRILTTIVYL